MQADVWGRADSSEVESLETIWSASKSARLQA